MLSPMQCFNYKLSHSATAVNYVCKMIIKLASHRGGSLTFQDAFYESLVLSQGLNLTNWRGVLSKVFDANISKRKTDRTCGLCRQRTRESNHPFNKHFTTVTCGRSKELLLKGKDQ